MVMRLQEAKHTISETLHKCLLNVQKLKDDFIKYIRKNEYKFSNLIQTNYQLGMYHLRSHNMLDAELRFRLVLYFKPNHHMALYQLARCLYAKNKISSAKKKLKLALTIAPSFQEADYFLGMIDDGKEPSKIPISIIEEYYNRFAVEFDDEFSCSNGYRLPEYLIDAVLDNIKDKNDKYSVLDIGCGTGQCSKELVSRIKIDRLIGVDISENMLKEAKKLIKEDICIFDKLVEADYSDYITKTKGKYDIIIAGLSLHFQRVLSTNLAKMKNLLTSGGFIVFSVEKAFDDNLDANLNYSFENFCYNKAYVEGEVKKAKLKLHTITEHSIKNDRIAFIVVCGN